MSKLDFHGPLEVGAYSTTEEFRAVDKHVCVHRGDGMLIATVGPHGDETSVAVGRLFAAAPELFEALREHLVWYEGGDEGLRIDENALIKKTRAALAKAEGKS